ncbi:MAG: hypothetical protein PF442_07700 [Desulfobulbaceae bacterium]|nr:hypothetical protein [Desulfobulbaceae bacterium]
MIDYHCHILPGLDDGAKSMDDALSMATILAEHGFSEIYCTPHCIRGVYDNTPAMVCAGVAQLQGGLDQAGIKLQLHPGMEYYLDEYFSEALKDPQPLGTTKLLLVEAPGQANFELIKENIFLAVRQGFTPLFAHPERYHWLTPGQVKQRNFLARVFDLLRPASVSQKNNESQDANPELADLQAQGCLFQGNIGSFVGQYGREVKERAEQLHHNKFYHCFGSDGHRPEPMRQTLQRGLDKLAG